MYWNDVLAVLACICISIGWYFAKTYQDKKDAETQERRHQEVLNALKNK